MFFYGIFLCETFSSIKSHHNALYWIPGHHRKGPMNQGLSALLSRIFLGIGSLFFSKTQHGARDPCVVVRDRAVLFERIYIFAQKMDKKQGFINLLEHLVINFLNLVYNESLCYLLYSGTNPIFRKNLASEIYSRPIRFQDF